MITIYCQCCNKEGRFPSMEAAFDAGWDCPPYFSVVCTCEECPSALVVLGIRHKHANVAETIVSE